MPLPKVKTPQFKLKLPSNKKEIWYRPFRLSEEKILLLAKESDDNEEVLRAIKQVLSNCIVEPKNFDVTAMTTFDMEYYFLKLRAKSVGEIVNLQVTPIKTDEDLPPMEITINLDKLEPKTHKDHDKLIDLGDDIQIEMKYPTIDDLNTLPQESTSEVDQLESSLNMFKKCMDKIYENGEPTLVEDATDEEIEEFIQSLSTEHINKIKHFFETMPSIEKDVVYQHTYENGKTYTETITIKGLMSFLA